MGGQSNRVLDGIADPTRPVMRSAGPSLPVEIEIVYAYPASAQERSQVEAWVGANDCALISRIWISATAVNLDGLEGAFRFRTGTAVRHGELVDELTEAHFNLGRATRWHV